MNQDDAAEQTLLQHPRNTLLPASIHDGDSLPTSRPTGSLALYGLSSTLHTVTADNIAAAQAQASSFLLPWRGETVDRYDVRLLLDEQTAAVGERPQRLGKRKRQTSEQQQSTEEEDGRVSNFSSSEDLGDEDDSTLLREALLPYEVSSGHWRLEEMERERYRDLADEQSDSEMEDDEPEATATQQAAAGRQWHYEYGRQRLHERRQEAGWKADEDDTAAEAASAVLPRPSSPPPPPFKPSFHVPPHVELVHHQSRALHARYTPRLAVRVATHTKCIDAATMLPAFVSHASRARRTHSGVVRAERSAGGGAAEGYPGQPLSVRLPRRRSLAAQLLRVLEAHTSAAQRGGEAGGPCSGHGRREPRGRGGDGARACGIRGSCNWSSVNRCECARCCCGGWRTARHPSQSCSCSGK